MTQWGLDNLFNPGKRHMDDEKRRLQSTREEVGDNSGGRRIDLEGGKVSIAVRRPTDTAVDEPSDPGDQALDDPARDDTALDDTALDAALAAEDVPAVALANDEAEIVPELVDEADAGQTVPEPVVAAVVEAPEPEVDATPEVVEPVEDDVTGVVAEPVEDDVTEVEDAPADDVPIEAPAPEPVAAAPRKKQLSANAWSRRG